MGNTHRHREPSTDDNHRGDENTYAYEVLEDYGDWELREYPARVAAQASSKTGSAFRVLAAYIGVMSTPQNSGRTPISMTSPVVEGPEQIAMTSPVVNIPEEISMTSPVVENNNFEMMQFILPIKYKTVEDAPVPTNPDVEIVMTQPKMMACQTIRGRYMKSKDFEEIYKEIAPEIAEEGYSEVGKWEAHMFDSPMVPKYKRRNDICIPVVDLEEM